MSAPLRVAGTDPGSSSLDVLILEDGLVVDQKRFSWQELQAEPAAPVKWLSQRGPLQLVVGPAGYGVPLVGNRELTDAHLEQMILRRPDEHNRPQGILGFRATVQAFREATFPVVFPPGVIHLPTVPEHRKFNRIDLGTSDKLCVAALAIAQGAESRCCVVELGTVFTACVVIQNGQIVDGVGGTAGPVGWQGCGAWDGELAYLLSPVTKDNLFHDGASQLPRTQGMSWFVESLVKTIAGLRAITPFEQVLVSGRLSETEQEVAQAGTSALGAIPLPSLPGAWVKHAAQGAAVIADGLAGGRYADLVERLCLREARGSVIDWIVGDRAKLDWLKEA